MSSLTAVIQQKAEEPISTKLASSYFKNLTRYPKRRGTAALQHFPSTADLEVFVRKYITILWQKSLHHGKNVTLKKYSHCDLYFSQFQTVRFRRLHSALDSPQVAGSNQGAGGNSYSLIENF